MKMVSLGTVPIDPDKVAANFPVRFPPRAAAVSDISIANYIRLHDVASRDEMRLERNLRPIDRIDSLGEILTK